MTLPHYAQVNLQTAAWRIYQHPKWDAAQDMYIIHVSGPWPWVATLFRKEVAYCTDEATAWAALRELVQDLSGT
jgi:hypothetical protein